MTQEIEIHRNFPQLLFDIVRAKSSTLIWARGSGKTRGAGSDFCLHNIKEMPRSNGQILCNSYIDILVKILPNLVQGWAEYGFKEEMHYFIGRYAPDVYNWPKAYRYPRDPKHYMHWFNGSGVYLVSGDHSITNGNDTDWMLCEETRLQDPAKVREAELTLRGNNSKFGNKACHYSTLYISDMPRSSKERWILEKRNLMDEADIEKIIALAYKIDLLQQVYEGSKENNKQAIKIHIDRMATELNKMRSNAVYFSTATTFDNIHSLGLDPIKNFKSILSRMDFLISVCNQEILKLESGFYATLDSDKHGYNADDIQYFESLGIIHDIQNAGKYERDCRWDADCNPDQPIFISPDYNFAINCAVIGQSIGSERRFINSMHVLTPEYTRELAHKVCRYYKPHRNKTCFFVYDHTAIGRDATGDRDYAAEWITILENNGWLVKRCYIGKSPWHDTRYSTWQEVLTETGKYPFSFKYNRRNCDDLYLSMSMAPVVQDRNEFKKDKRSERDPNIKPQHATHFSEAADILMHAWTNPELIKSSAYLGTSFGS